MNGLGARLRMSAVTAPAKLASARPASKMTARLARGPAIRTSPPMETSAPAIPASGTASDVADAKPNAIVNDEAAAAACGAPNRAGSASGLRSSPCNAAPERPSVAPIRTASNVRGRRISRTTTPAGPSPESNPTSAARGDRPAGPTISESTISTTMTAASARLSRMVDAVVMNGYDYFLRRGRVVKALMRRSIERLDATSDTNAWARDYARMKRIMPLPLWLALMLAFPAAAQAADAPRRVASFNLCADQLVVALADPEQIAGLSPYAADPALSVVAERRSISASSTGRPSPRSCCNPICVLVGPNDRPVTQRMLGHREALRVVGGRIRHRSRPAHATQIRDVARLLGHPDRGEKLVAALDAARARLAARRSASARTAVVIERGGYAQGPASLAAALLEEAGLKSPPGAPKGYGGFIPLEKLLMLKPDLVFVKDPPSAPNDQGALYFMHPAMAALFPPTGASHCRRGSRCVVDQRWSRRSIIWRGRWERRVGRSSGGPVWRLCRP